MSDWSFNVNQLNDMKTSKFELIEFLGNGAMGKAYLAEHIETGRLYVLKFIKRDGIKTERGIYLSLRICHKNFVKCYGYFMENIDNETYYISILEFFQGYNLGDLLIDNTLKTILPNVNKLSIIKQLVDAMEYLHKINLIHRDIKDENILVNAKGEIKIIDYDFLMDMNYKDSEKCGTPYYASPEILLGKNISEKTDLWSLGVTIYIILTRLYPFDGNDIDDVTFSIIYSEPDMSIIPWKYKEIIKGLLQKDPSDRISLDRARNLLKNL